MKDVIVKTLITVEPHIVNGLNKYYYFFDYSLEFLTDVTLASKYSGSTL